MQKYVLSALCILARLILQQSYEIDVCPPSTLGNHRASLLHSSSVFWKISCKCNHTVCNLCRLASFTQHNAFEVHPNWCPYPSSIPFPHWVVFHCMDVPQLIHSPVEAHVSCFQSLPSMNGATINIGSQIFVWIWVFLSLGIVFRDC